MADLGTAYVRVAGDFSQLNAQAVGLFRSSAWSKYGKVAGAALAGGLAAAGIAKIAFDIGQEFDDAFDKIQTRTGATGKELAKLEKSFKGVLKSVPTDFDTASEAVAGLNQRLDLSGKPLNQLAKQLTALSKITGEDIGSTVPAVTRLFGDWSVKTSKQTQTLDKLFRLTQDTGIAFNDLSELMVQFGSPLRQLGFSFDEAAVMFARFEKEGVNMQTLLPGLRYALKNIAVPTDELAGLFEEFGVTAKEPHDALLQIFDLLSKDKISEADQTLLASQVFGGRAWADMKAAVEEGRFEFEDLIKGMKRGDSTIRGTERSTRDFSEQWQLFGNRLKVFVEPAATAFFEFVGDGMKELNRLMKGKGSLSEAFRDLKPVLDFIGNYASKVFGGIGQVFGGVVTAVKGFTDILSGIFQGDWSRAWDGAKAVVSGTVEALKGTIRTLTAPFRAVFGAIRGAAVAAFDKVLGALSTTLDGIAKGADLMSKLPGPIGDAWDKVQTGAEDASDSIDGFRESMRGFNRLDKDAKKSARGISHSLDGVRASLAQSGRDFDKTADKGGKDMDRLRRDSDSHSRKMARDVVGNVGRMVDGSGGGFRKLVDNTNKALKGFGVDKQTYISFEAGRANLPRQRGGPVPGSGEGDKVPAMLEPGEYVLNKKLTKALGRPMLDMWNHEMVPRMQAGGLAGLQPGISRLAKWAADRYGLRISSGLRPGDVDSFHGSGEAADLITPGETMPNPAAMSATKGIFAAFKNQLAELFYDPWGGFDEGQMIGAIGGHLDHIHAAIRGAGGGPAGIARLKRILLKGPAGPLRDMGQAGLDRAHKAARAYLSRQTMSTHGNIGNISGPLQAIARRMVTERWGAGQWPPFNELVMRESGWDPTAVNPSSGAAGLAQALPPSKYPPGAWPYSGKESAVKQLQWMIQYVAGRYGTPAGALGFHDAHNYYKLGGPVLPYAGNFAGGGTVPGPIGSPQAAIVHGGERISRDGKRELVFVKGVVRIEGDRAKIEGIAQEVVRGQGRHGERMARMG